MAIKILSVELIPGSVLKPYWKNTMQKIITENNDKFYIDEYEPNHVDWSKHIGELISDIEEYKDNQAFWRLRLNNATGLTIIESTKSPNFSSTHNEIGFRAKFPATFRTDDGHMVRSRAEVIIDNALYNYRLVHAYEKKLPIEEDLYSDFYLPSENVYIEYWGMEDDEKYSERKKIKIEIYKKYGFKLIELNDTDLTNLDDYLPKKLLKYNVKIY